MKYLPYLYGAYGSNLDKRQMAIRCPDAKPVTSMILPNWVLRFRGVADIEPDAEGEVSLGLWQITEKCEQRLDVYEGYPNLYGKEFLKTAAGLIMVYSMVDKHDVYPPPNRYLSGISAGYTHFMLDMEPLMQALKHSWSQQAT